MALSSKTAASILWNYLKNKRLGGYAFQYKTKAGERHVFEIYCEEAKVLVRVGCHEEITELQWQEQMRIFHQFILNGVYLLPFSSDDIYYHIDDVLSAILKTLHERSKYWRQTVSELN